MGFPAAMISAHRPRKNRYPLPESERSGEFFKNFSRSSRPTASTSFFTAANSLVSGLVTKTF